MKKLIVLMLSSISVIGYSQDLECCFGSTADITAAGGTTYVWSNGPTSALNPGVTAGSYTVTVSDANGCSATATYVVANCPQLTLACSGVDNTNCTTPNGTATVTPTGGCSGGYTYSWNTTPIQTTQTATGLDAGTYIVTVETMSSTGAICSETCQVVIVDNVTPPTATITGSCN